jgi:sortase A
VRKTRSVEDLSVDELRHLLVEKRRSARRERLENYRRTGRVVALASDVAASPFEPGAVNSLPVADLPAAPQRSGLSRFFDGVLLLIEIAAVIGLGFVLYSGFNVLRQLNREYSASLVQPTISPTPLIVAVVLPGGHTPPDAQGQTKFNVAEIPEHLRPIYQALADVPVPTQAPAQALHLQIPAIGMGMTPIVLGDGPEQLKKGIGQHIGSANPGQNSNVVLSAHNDIYGEIFRDLDKLKKGDLVIVYTAQRAYTYVISENPKVVEPSAVEVMAPTEDAVVTLISCYPYLVDNKRIVVRARLQK